VAAEQRVLAQHQLLRAHALLRGGEPVVPDERHALDERPARAHHAVEPPEVVVAPGVGGGERASLRVAGRRADEALAAGPGQRQDRAVETERGELLRLSLARPEARTPEQALGLGAAERTTVGSEARCGGHIRRIGLAPRRL
jgi:hypothetical protein